MACLFGDKAKDQCARLVNQGCAGSICPMYEDDTATRERVLDAAKACVCGGRPMDYGTPEDNFVLVAKLWNTYLGDCLMDAHDVAIMMALLKIARIKTGRGKMDNYVDLAGYAACAAEIRCGK